MARFAFQSQDSGSDQDEPLYFGPSPLPLSRAKRSRRLFRRVILAIVVGFGLASALALQHVENSASSGAGSSMMQPPPPPAWIDIVNPAELFGLGAPEFAGEAKSYTARRHRTGGGRQDILAFGDLNGPGPFLRVVFYRVGEEGRPPGAFFVDLARHAAETGRAITFAAQPTALPTRLGLFEAADLNLTQTGSPDTPCLGFRIAQPAKLRLTGFMCGGDGGKTGAAFASKAKLACLLDSLELAPSADDKELAAFFAARELNDHTACNEAAMSSSEFVAPSSVGRQQKPDEAPIKSP